MSATSVRGTNDDATVSKLSAARLGYYEDPFLEFFIAPQAVKRRAPLINRGYWSRVAAIYDMVNDFLKSGPNTPKQVVNLGAGFDTMYFRLKAAAQKDLRSVPFTKFFEIDYPETVTTKVKIIKRHHALWNLIKGAEGKEGDEAGIDAGVSDYALIGADLCDVKDLEEKLVRNGIDPSLPTLILSECVLVYLKPEDSTGVIEWASKFFKGGAVFISYEQINPWDPFGQTMLQNLKARGCSLLGLETFPDLVAQRARFESRGWKWWAGWDMNNIYRFYVNRADVVRIEKLELFDELEEWHMIQGHYCIQVAATPPQGQEQSWMSSIGLLGAQVPTLLASSPTAIKPEALRALAPKLESGSFERKSPKPQEDGVAMPVERRSLKSSSRSTVS